MTLNSFNKVLFCKKKLSFIYKMMKMWWILNSTSLSIILNSEIKLLISIVMKLEDD